MMRAMESIARLDLAFSTFCLQHKFNQQVARVSRAVSHTGDGHLYMMIGLLAWLMDPQIGKAFFLTGLLAFGLELPVYWVLKNSFKRRRPKEVGGLTTFITPSDRYSLPSGHTAAGFVMAVLLAHFYPELGVFAFFWAGCIGTARILLGVHFLSDVMIGALLGVLSTQTALLVIGG